MNDTVHHPSLIADNVHITYRTYLDAVPGLRSRLKTGFVSSAPRYKDVHAVKGASFTLYEGDCLGIVGSNGSGKSSLLAGLAGLLDLQEGTVLASARPSLLGVGAVLDRRLSGRRNAIMGCLALGLSRAEIDQVMPELIEFTGLEEFMDMPLKTYSQGMRARLAFTIATVVKPEILLVDEALAVGDRSFRDRAAERLTEIRGSAGSVIVVSHNLQELRRMCTRMIWLEKGELRADGTVDEVLDMYKGANPVSKRTR